jgi:hypothetical protein
VTWTTLVADRLYAISGTVPAPSDASWIPSHFAGHLPVSCYVLVDGRHGLLIDTGLPLHREGVGEALSKIMGGLGTRDMIMTRREPDNIINLPPFIPLLDLQTIYCGGIIDPLDFFDRMDEANTSAHFIATAARRPTWIVPGAAIRVGELNVEVMRAELRVLATNYLFEPTTRTLFGADSWGLLTQDHPEGLAIVREFDQRMTAPEIVRYLHDKYDWMRGANLAVVRANIASLSRGRTIARLCPTFGCVIEGEDTIRRLLDETIKALEILEGYAPVDRLRGFDAAMYRRGIAGPPVL